MKKIAILIAALFVIGILSACDDVDVDSTSPLEVAYDTLDMNSTLYSDDNGVTVLPSHIGDASIIWTSNLDGIVVDNQVIHSSIERNITLTAAITIDGKTMVKAFDVIVAPGSAVQVDPVCTTEETLVNNICVPIEEAPTCNDNEELVDNTCVLIVDDPVCQVGEVYVDGECVSDYVGPVYTGYYDGASNLSGETLKSFLHDLIDGHTVISYTAVSEALKVTDLDPNNSNNIILLYSGDSIDKDYRCSTSCPSDSWNKEHVWPQSLGDFGTGDAPGTDLHALRPTYVPINSTRSSLDFDNGGTEIYFDGVATGNYYDSDSFEPRDDVKGDIARMMFYMAVRYEGDDGYADLEIDEICGDGAPTIGVLSVLLQWHIDDPVSESEIYRNDIIYNNYQGNRNPFIDHPEFVSLIWGN